MGIKKTKSGEREINVRPLAIAIDPQTDGFSARLMLTEKDTLKPDLLVRVLAEMAGVALPEARIHRMTLLGADEAGQLQPLMSL